MQNKIIFRRLMMLIISLLFVFNSSVGVWANSQTRIAIGAVNAIQEGQATVSAIKEDNPLGVATHGVGTALNAVAALSGLKAVVPTNSSYMEKLQCMKSAGNESAAKVSAGAVEGGSKTDFYVTPSGEAVPATGYRYMPRNADYIPELKETMVIPSNPNGTYISFDRFETPNPQKLQVPHDASIRGKFDTLQIIDDIRMPNGKWGKASWKEPITNDFPKYGSGGATQAITNYPIILDELEDLLR